MSRATIDADTTSRRAWDDPAPDLPTPTAAQITSLTSAAIERANGRIDLAVAAAAEAEARGDAPTFEALFGALDDAAREVAIAFGQGAAQLAMARDESVREAAFAAKEQIEKWRAWLPMREDLAAAVEGFAARAGVDALDEVEGRYVDRWRTDIRMAGGGLPRERREELARLTDRLLEVGSAFQVNLALPPHVTARRSELEGLPESVRASATPLGDDPELVDLEIHGGTQLAVLERSPVRALRERVYRAWTTRGVPENLVLLDEAVRLRRRIAAIAGYPSWQAFRAENLAAPDPGFAERFLDDLATRLRPVEDRELEAMAATLRSEPGAPADLTIEDWDWRYAGSVQRAALGADPGRLSEYFELGRVLEGLAELSAEVFGIRLEPRPERVGWDPDVRPFDVVDVASGRVLAHLFVDPFARPGKQSGAWMEWLLPGGGRHGEQRTPTISLVLNVSPPGDGPALLRAPEVETLFHEYGHVMNQASAPGRFVIHREQWTPFDFVEGPSEFNGRWGLQPAVIARFGRHVETGAPIPPELVEAVLRSEALNVVVEFQRLLAMARFDVLVHGEAEVSIDDAIREAWAIRGVPYVEGTSMPASLGHILGGSYDAALYGYAWSQVIRDDLLERFEAGGLTSPEMGALYRRTILEVAWIDDPVAAVNAFLGRPWSIDAFLRRASA